MRNRPLYLIHRNTQEVLPVVMDRYVGRSIGDFRFPKDARLSPKQFRVMSREDGIYLQSFGSEHATYFDGALIPVGEPSPISFGKEIRAGEQIFILSRRSVERETPFTAELYTHSKKFAISMFLGMFLLVLSRFSTQ